MRKERLVLFVALTVACSSPEALVEPESAAAYGEPSAPVLVAQVGQFDEGVVFDHDGRLYVSHEDQVSRLTLGEEVVVETWTTTTSPNGHKVLADGTHVVCDREGAVYLLDSEGEITRTIPVDTGCNDVALDGREGFYFSSPYGSQEDPSVGKVYHVASAAAKPTVAASELYYPNGLALTRDGSTLFVGESFANRILAYPVESPGRLGAYSVFATMPNAAAFDPANYLAGPMPDGMALDTDGNLYVANYGAGAVQVFAPNGAHLRSIPAGSPYISNVAFGGREMNQLYIVGGTGPVQQGDAILMRVELPGVTGLTILPKASTR